MHINVINNAGSIQYVLVIFTDLHSCHVGYETAFI